MNYSANVSWVVTLYSTVTKVKTEMKRKNREQSGTLCSFSISGSISLVNFFPREISILLLLEFSFSCKTKAESISINSKNIESYSSKLLVVETYRNILEFIKISGNSFPLICYVRKNLGTLRSDLDQLCFPYFPI